MTKQYQSESIKELSAALAKAQGDMRHAGKSAENPYFKSKYADLPAVIDAAKVALSVNGLSVTQFTDIDENQNIVLITQLNHSAGEWMRGYYPVKPVKQDPQGLGSALTYARRYAYSAIVGVAATGEDDDGNLASGNIVKAKPETAASRKARYIAIKEALEKSDDPAVTWHENGAEIEEFKESLGIDYHQQLIDAGKNRKLELQSILDTGERK